MLSCTGPRQLQADTGDTKRLRRSPAEPPTENELCIHSSCRPLAHGSVHFVVDCLSVKNIMCGLTSLRRSSCRPIYTRMAKGLAEILPSMDLGQDVLSDPVVWVRRENNKLADTFCNYTMDLGRSWQQQWPQESCNMANCSIVCFSDGGSRSRCCAASAWALALGAKHSGNWTFKLVCAGGVFHGTYVDAFEAETIALEQAILTALNHLKHDI